jgi:FkbM family methyltransferase
MNVKKAIRSLARKAGLEISRYRPTETTDGRLVATLRAHRVDVVLDVGANIGQFGESLRDSGYRGRIVSFEPLSDAWSALRQTSAHDSLWDVAERCALGEAEGEVQLHIAGNSVSSSVLEMLSTHTKAAPDSAYVGMENVKVRTLDSVASQYLNPKSISFLKIDTQGYEDRVLRGATQLLDRIVGLQLEMSFVALYEGQLTFDDLRDRLTARGFELWGLSPGFVDPNTGRLLQVDATFFRA